MLLSQSAVSATLAAVPAGSAAAASTAPPCSFADIPTSAAGYGDWTRTLLDTAYRLPASYAPRDLVAVRRAGIAGVGSVRSLVIADLAAMTTAARRAGAPIAVESSYRSYSTQVYTFAYWVRVEGLRTAQLSSARPGHSEHQLGTALDFMSLGGGAPWNYRDWATTQAGKWMVANAWRYGFVMSYPRGSSPSLTCYQYEPWHYRYFGRTVAAAIHASGLAPRVYLWRQQTTPKPPPTPTPTPIPTPTVPAPTPTPAATPTLPAPAPTPAATSTPAPTPTPTASPTASATASPSPEATATPDPTSEPTESAAPPEEPPAG